MPLESLVLKILSDLKKERLNYPKTIIFCRRYQDCTDLYSAMVCHLGQHKTEPPGYPNLLEFCLITMYTRASTAPMKKIVLSLFGVHTHHILHVVIAITAFSMCTDCPDILQVIHWEASCNLEHYLQEIDRAGRDGEASHALLICTKNRHVEQQMKSYYENQDSCQCVKLFNPFIMYEHCECAKCKCCDVCSISCDCDDCKSN